MPTPHPYTVSLLSAVPEPNPRPKKKRIVLPGEVPSPSNPPTGCPFHPRCPLTRQLAAQASANETVEIPSGDGSARVIRKCVEQIPPLEPLKTNANHTAACWFAEQARVWLDRNSSFDNNGASRSRDVYPRLLSVERLPLFLSLR